MNIFVVNALIAIYMKFEFVRDAHEMFKEVFGAFKRMESYGVTPLDGGRRLYLFLEQVTLYGPLGCTELFDNSSQTRLVGQCQLLLRMRLTKVQVQRYDIVVERCAPHLKYYLKVSRLPYD
ncbi:hypothetical protein LR48_Vigan10g136400 [Vigna angularis]|uniref:Pentatricopeptide repeat-containing protein n=1 Tax=Phaseolus angularis TaxID=3914 RepID=A0A0L9VKR2_PHAAN|nr:hypothetical protein LR48_Vigan10g136400 [Vigna angularis]